MIRQQTLNPTVDTSAYVADDQLGTLQTINWLIPGDGRGGILKQIKVTDKAKQKAPIDFFFFRRSVTLAADNAPFSISDADMAFCYGVLNVLATDYDDSALNSVATVAPPQGLHMDGVGGVPGTGTRGRIWMAMAIRGGATYAAADLAIDLSVESEE